MYSTATEHIIDIKPSVLHDIAYLKSRLRKQDVDEIWASNNLTPAEALTYSFYLSKVCLTVFDEEPVAMFGIVEDPTDDERALIWLLGSERLNRVARLTLDKTREYIEGFLDSYPTLYNHIDARNKKAIRWLKHLGAEVREAEPYGKERLPFHLFQFRRVIIHA